MQNQHNVSSETASINTLVERLLYFAQTTPTHDAIVTPTLRLSYQQLAERTIAQVIALKEIDISADDTVGINCADDVQHLVLCLATCYLGATSCTIPSYENTDAQAAISERCGVTHTLNSSAVVALSATNKHIDLTTVQKPAAKARLLFSTSGSTGTPKLVMHHDSDLVAQAHRHVDSTQERFACRASIEHNFSKRHRLYCLAVGASNVFLSGELDAVVEECLALQVNVLHVSAFQAQELLTLPGISQLSGIRLKLGGSHVPLAVRNALRTNITPILQAGYGTTETGAIAFTNPDDQHAAESVGKALPGMEIQCVDAQRRPVEQGVRGEVAIRSKGMFRGYYKNPDLTAKHLENSWFYTGDIAYLDAQQRIHLCGRSDDMFTFNSMNIYPQEIESVIRQFPDVVDTVVLPKPSSTHGNIPVALVVYNPSMRPNLSALKNFVEKQAGVRSPRQYTFVDQIPTNLSGKVSRIAAASLSVKSDQVREKLIQLIDEPLIRQLRASQLKSFITGKRDLSFRKLGMDSLARMNLLVALETNYDIVISPQELTRIRTLGKLASKMLMLSEAPPAPQEAEHTIPSFENVTVQSRPYIVRFLDRLCNYCETVAQLNQTFAKLEHRLTPLDIAHLDQAHSAGQLTTKQLNEKFQSAISAWLNETKQLMFNSGKRSPEPFTLKRIAPTMSMFSSSTSNNNKTLLIGFPPRDVRHMMMPNAVLLQHIDATQYDLLIISPEANGGYQFGTLPFGKKLNQQAQWLHQQSWLKPYQHIRTFGFSAGSFPAIALGHLLQAEIALSIAGRFHKKKRFLINLDKIMTMRKILKKGCHCNVLLSYSLHNKRDQKFANYFTKACSGKVITVEIKTERLPHLLLRRLTERGDLASYLNQTLFTTTDRARVGNGQQNENISFPATQTTMI